MDDISDKPQVMMDAIVKEIKSVFKDAEITKEKVAFLQRLDLSNKGIKSLKAEDFEGLTGLKHLDLSNNKLEIFPLLFEHAPKLEVLNISGNRFPKDLVRQYKMVFPELVKKECIIDSKSKAVEIGG